MLMNVCTRLGAQAPGRGPGGARSPPSAMRMPRVTECRGQGVIRAEACIKRFSNGSAGVLVVVGGLPQRRKAGRRHVEEARGSRTMGAPNGG